jgi:hypothetical protein
MDQATVEDLRQRLARLQEELAALAAQAKDFPALERGARRAGAALAMMELALGASAVEVSPR